MVSEAAVYNWLAYACSHPPLSTFTPWTSGLAERSTSRISVLLQACLWKQRSQFHTPVLHGQGCWWHPHVHKHYRSGTQAVSVCHCKTRRILSNRRDLTAAFRESLPPDLWLKPNDSINRLNMRPWHLFGHVRNLSTIRLAKALI